MKNDAKRLIWLFLAPAVVLYGVLFIYPVAASLFYSLYDWDGFTQQKHFVGLGNFTLLAHDPMFWTALRHNLFLLTVPTVIVLAAALFLAAALSSGVRGARFFRVVFFFPNIMSMVAITVLWSFIYNPGWGLLAGLLRPLAGAPALVERGHLLAPFAHALKPTLTKLAAASAVVPLDPNNFLNALVAPIVWCGLGFYMVLFLAGMESIPTTYYEAAKIDGASAWQQFRSITIPLLWDILTMAVVFLVIGGLRIFDLIYVMSLGYPTETSQVISTYLYEQAFNNAHMGYGLAIAVVLFVLVFGATAIAMRLMRREQTEY